MAKTKYQIFVSSTYEDLKQERDVAIKAILEMGHIPVGMEMFSAADDEQWEIIRRQIDDSDYYVVIVAHRYGSMSAGVSYTEKEYDYALAARIPVLGFVIHDSAEWPFNRIEDDPAAKESLIQFKDKVKKKPVGFWKNEEDLHSKVSIALMKAFTTSPQPGWVRATTMVGPEVTNELSRLSTENAQLRATLEVFTREKERIRLEQEHFSETENLLKSKRVFLTVKFTDNPTWVKGPDISLYEIFELIAPQLLIEAGLVRLSSYTATMFSKRVNLNKVPDQSWPVPRNHVQHWLSAFHSLGLVCPSSKRHAVKDDEAYWTLTDEGRRFNAISTRRSFSFSAVPKVEDEAADN